MAFDFAWQVHWQAYSKIKGRGTHDLPCEPTTWRQHKGSQGPTWVPFHKCNNCGLEVARSSWPLLMCTMSPSSRKPFAKEKRKQQWQSCSQKGRKAWQDSKHSDGQKTTRRGLRARRVGEAQHPGPDKFNVWSENIRAWNTNGDALLSDASEHADVLLLQETNVSENGPASLLHKAQRFGWQALQVPLPSRQGNRGGVAILVKAGIAIVEVARHPDAPLAECFGFQESFLLVSCYRHGSHRQFPTKIFPNRRHCLCLLDHRLHTKEVQS